MTNFYTPNGVGRRRNEVGYHERKRGDKEVLVTMVADCRELKEYLATSTASETGLMRGVSTKIPQEKPLTNNRWEILVIFVLFTRQMTTLV